MASLGHAAVGLALGRVARPGASLRGALGPMVFFTGLALLPDLDVIGFKLGVHYGDPWGHRGATHALPFALALGAVLGLLTRSRRLWLLGTVALVSHGLLDTLTDGGLGVALFWPFDLTRYFAPWRPIPVAPIGARFLSARGLHCVGVELQLFAPAWLWALWPRRAAAGPA
jgi:inner membrane protein